jgi:D-alanine--poly(phosphoribitol) ligase subunit 2
MDRMLIREKVKSYLTVNFLIDFGGDVTDDTNLFESGRLDSFAFVQLVGFFESEFKLKLTDDDMTSDGLTSLAKMTQLINDRTHG